LTRTQVSSPTGKGTLTCVVDDGNVPQPDGVLHEPKVPFQAARRTCTVKWLIGEDPAIPWKAKAFDAPSAKVGIPDVLTVGPVTAAVGVMWSPNSALCSAVVTLYVPSTQHDVAESHAVATSEGNWSDVAAPGGSTSGTDTHPELVSTSIGAPRESVGPMASQNVVEPHAASASKTLLGGRIAVAPPEWKASSSGCG